LADTLVHLYENVVEDLRSHHAVAGSISKMLHAVAWVAISHDDRIVVEMHACTGCTISGFVQFECNEMPVLSRTIPLVTLAPVIRIGGFLIAGRYIRAVGLLAPVDIWLSK